MPPVGRLRIGKHDLRIDIHYNDHNPPHVHVASKGMRTDVGYVELTDDGAVKNVDKLSKAERKELFEWVSRQRRGLDDNWQRMRAGEPLVLIEDQTVKKEPSRGRTDAQDHARGRARGTHGGPDVPGRRGPQR